MPDGASADQLRRLLIRMNTDFRDKAPVSAAEAAAVILDGVRSGTWRILIGGRAVGHTESGPVTRNGSLSSTWTPPSCWPPATRKRTPNRPTKAGLGSTHGHDAGV